MDGLYQEKWYSHESLKTNPFGYWMWRADWKLKQLVQGALHDDVTGKREDMKCCENLWWLMMTAGIQRLGSVGFPKYHHPFHLGILGAG